MTFSRPRYLIGGAAALALALTLGACATGVGNTGADATEPTTDVVIEPTAPTASVDATDSTEPCVEIDQQFYGNSRELENAADVTVVGEITEIESQPDDAAGPIWLVHFRGEGARGQSAEQAMGEITVRFPRVCGDAPYSDAFAPGGRFILLLSGPATTAESPDLDPRFEGSFTPTSTTQGVVPIIDGHATPLPGAYLDPNGGPITISYTTAAGFGAPLIGAPEPSGDFTAGQIFDGISDDVVPQFWNANVGAAWSPDPGVLWVFTAGSTGCPLYASSPAVVVPGADDHDELQVTLSSQLNPDDICLSDLVWSTTEVAVPLGIREDQPLTVHFGPDGTPNSGEPRTIVVPPRRVLDDGIQLGVPGEAAWAEPVIAHQHLDADSLGLQPGGWVQGIPTGVDVPTADSSLAFYATWAPTAEDKAPLLYVITWGSGSCPTLAEPQATVEDGVVIIGVRPSETGRPCTRDWSPTTSIVAVPADVDTTQPVSVRLGDQGTLVVPPRAEN